MRRAGDMGLGVRGRRGGRVGRGAQAPQANDRGVTRAEETPASAHPWADPALPMGVPQLRQLHDDQVTAFLLDTAEQLLAGGTETPLGSARPDLPAHTDTHPLFQAAAALHGVEREEPRIATTLTKLRATMLNHRRSLMSYSDRALLDQPTESQNPQRPKEQVFYRYGLGELHGDERLRQRTDALRELHEVSARINAALSERTFDSLLDATTRRLRRAATASSSSSILERMLHAGRPHADILMLAGITPSDSEVIEPRIARFMQLTRAYRILGVRCNWPREIFHEAQEETSRDLLAFTASAATGDILEQLYNRHQDVFPPPPRPELASAAADAVACAHGLLRNTPQHVRGGAFATDLRANVVVSAPAFAGLAARFSSEQLWEGIRPFVCAPLRAAGDADPFGEIPPNSHHVGAAATIRANIDGRNIAVRFLIALGHDEERAVRARRASVAALLAEKVSAKVALDPSDAPHHTDLEQWGRNDVETLPRDWNREAPKRSGRAEFLGRSDCAHEGATWLVHSAGDTAPPYLRLSCRRCLRSQIATVPLHRSPYGLLDDPDAARSYVRAYRAQAAFRGHLLPEAITLADLIERDGHISMEPGDYATVSKSHLATPRGLGARRARRR